MSGVIIVARFPLGALLCVAFAVRAGALDLREAISQ